MTLNKCVRAPCEWSDAMSCDNDVSCEWYLGNQTCIAKVCPYKTKSTCDQHSNQCTYNGDGNGTCVKTCPLYGTRDECIAAKCDWTFEGKCQDTCSSMYVGKQVQCQGDDNCAWDFSKSKCLDACAKSATWAGCEANPLCVWSGSFCRASCKTKYSSNDNTACKNDPSCELVVNTIIDGQIDYKCVEPCSRRNTSDCRTAFETECKMSGATCMTTCKARYGTLTDCIADATCIWTSTDCAESCEAAKYDEQACGTKDYC
jgi:hypothetical protein